MKKVERREIFNSAEFVCTGIPIATIMSYKGFLIEPQMIDSCTLNYQNGTLHVIGSYKVYRITDSVSRLIYGVKRSIEAAQKAIDKNGTRWRKN